jgi:hypothetical protein
LQYRYRFGNESRPRKALLRIRSDPPLFAGSGKISLDPDLGDCCLYSSPICRLCFLLKVKLGPPPPAPTSCYSDRKNLIEFTKCYTLSMEYFLTRIRIQRKFSRSRSGKKRRIRFFSEVESGSASKWSGSTILEERVSREGRSRDGFSWTVVPGYVGVS